MSRRMIENEQGGTLVVVAASLVAVVSMLALAIDVGMMLTARSEAQRAADAAALAGASAFMDPTSSASETPGRADARARDYASKNAIRGVAIDPVGEVMVAVDPAKYRVTVTVQRAAVQTIFARVFGVSSVAVSAQAHAEATAGGSTKCVLPFAVPDTWNETDPTSDVNQNRMWDPGEVWTYTAGVDGYSRNTTDPLKDCPVGDTAVGWGSCWRNTTAPGHKRDDGRKVTIKVTDPNDLTNPSNPGIFYPLRLSSSQNGAKDYENAISGSSCGEISLDSTYTSEPGNMVGPTHFGVSDLIAKDKNATWVQNPDGTGYVDGSAWPNWRDSPRVAKIALFEPGLIQDVKGQYPFKLNNFALVFIEGQETRHDPVIARFISYVDNTGSPGQTKCAGCMKLRLVN